MSSNPCHSPIPLLHAMKQFVHRVIERDIGKQHISLLHGQILRFVAEQKTVTMKDLSKHLSITPPSATSITEGLVKKQWIERVTDPSDRRIVRIRITPKGRAMVGKVRKSLEREWDAVLRTLSATEQKVLQDFTDRITHHTETL